MSAAPLPAVARSRQVAATATRPLRVLPEAWWEDGVAEAMNDWITRKNNETKEQQR